MLLFEVPKWNLCLSVSHCASCMVIINYLMYLAEWTSHWSSILSLHEKICEGCVADKQRTNVQHIHMCSYMENISHQSLLVCAAVDLLFDFSKSWRHSFGGLRPAIQQSILNTAIKFTAINIRISWMELANNLICRGIDEDMTYKVSISLYRWVECCVV